MAGIIDLVETLIESVKDLKYLTMMQIIEVSMWTGAAGLATYNLPSPHHDIKYTAIAAATVFAAHVHGLMKTSPSDSDKKAAVENAKVVATEKVAETTIKTVEDKGKADIEAAKKINPNTSSDSVMDQYIKDMKY
jgi:hypothetical protein